MGAPEDRVRPIDGSNGGEGRPRRVRRSVIAMFVLALGVSSAFRPGALIGLLLGALLLVPLERAFPLCRQRVLRRGLLADVTHFLLDGALIVIGTVVAVLILAIPLLPARAVDIEASVPSAVSIPLAVLLMMLGLYWGHRLTHRVPWLWRFHAVHHSIEEMDWVAAARLHPVDAVFTQTFAVMPLVLIGYDFGVAAGVTAAITALAIFQHANVRFRFPVIRWVLPTPEWHHWHHAADEQAYDHNFGLPFIDKLFGTAYLPRDLRPTGFGIVEPVPDDYLGQLRYPLMGT